MADLGALLPDSETDMPAQDRLADQFGPVFAEQHRQMTNLFEAAQASFDSMVALVQAAPNSDDAIDRLNVLLGQQLNGCGLALDRFRSLRYMAGSA